MSGSALEIRDAATTQAGSLGETLLSQSSQRTVVTQHVAKALLAPRTIAALLHDRTLGTSPIPRHVEPCLPRMARLAPAVGPERWVSPDAMPCVNA